MNARLPNARRSQQGMVLVSSLLLLIVVTLIALSMYRSFGIQEKIAGNVREKQRALQAAVSAQSFAEAWLLTNAAGTASAPCASALSANLGQTTICSNTLPSLMAPNTPGTLPWPAAGTTTYQPLSSTSQVMVVQAASVNAGASYGTYSSLPAFYISDMGNSTDPNYPGEIYQIDAVGYGGASSTVAEVESTYVVYTTSHQL
jgi:type IV pilus assembly protein PilX